MIFFFFFDNMWEWRIWTTDLLVISTRFVWNIAQVRLYQFNLLTFFITFHYQMRSIDDDSNDFFFLHSFFTLIILFDQIHQTQQRLSTSELSLSSVTFVHQRILQPKPQSMLDLQNQEKWLVEIFPFWPKFDEACASGLSASKKK